MALEIERKFLVDLPELGPLNDGIAIKQGYIATTNKTAVRARVKGDKAFLALKGENQGATRTEFEYQIPLTEGEQIIEQLCTGPTIEKTRYEIKHHNHLWEVDVFTGDNKGLVVAEIELSGEEEKFELPHWVTKEVTGEVKYYNISLLDYPFKDWA